MAPGTRSIVSTLSSVTTGPSVSAGEAKSLKNFESDEDFKEQMKESFDGSNPKDLVFHLISAPAGFPVSHLQDIPLNFTEPHKMSVGPDKQDYVCYNTSPTLLAPKILPFPNKSGFSCVNIGNTFCIRKTVASENVDKRHFIPRLRPRPMSKGLFERVKPFGWLKPGEKSNAVMSPTKRTKIRSSPKKKKKSPSKKTRKRKLTDSSSSLLLDTDSCSDKELTPSFPSPRKKVKRLKIATESPVHKLLGITASASETVIDPFVALNLDAYSSKLEKKRKKQEEEEEANGDGSDLAKKLHKKLKKEKKNKKHKKEKKQKKKKKKKSNKEKIKNES